MFHFKHFLHAFIAWYNWGKRLGEFQSRSVKTRDTVRDFQLLENSHKLCRGLWRHGEHVFVFFLYKIIIFCFNKENNNKWSMLQVYFNLFHETNCKFSQFGESQPYCSSFSCLIALWKHTNRPIVTHTVLSKLFHKWNHIKLVTSMQSRDIQGMRSMNILS